MSQRIRYCPDLKSLFGLFRCTDCLQTWAPGTLPKHTCSGAEIEFLLSPAARDELYEWAKKHGNDELHFSMRISLNDLHQQLPEQVAP